MEKLGVNAIMGSGRASASKDASDCSLFRRWRAEVSLLEVRPNENWPVKPASRFR